MTTASPSADVSLVVPTYNRAHLIAETIDSALSQQVSFREIIVVDDGSTDDTMARSARYGHRVTYVRTSNQGVQAARNHGVELARTKYVALCDSDDLLAQDYVSTVMSWLDVHPEVDVIYANFENFDAHITHKDKLSQAPEGFLNGSLKSGVFAWNIPDLYARSIDFQPMFPSGSICKRDFYKSIGGYDPHFRGVGAEDWEFCLRAIDCGSVALCTKVLVGIRRHPGNDSASILHMKLGEATILEYALENHAGSRKYSDLIRAGIRERKVSAYHGAYASGQLAMAMDVWRQLRPPPRDPKSVLKRAIIAMPEPLRAVIWKLSLR